MIILAKLAPKSKLFFLPKKTKKTKPINNKELKLIPEKPKIKLPNILNNQGMRLQKATIITKQQNTKNKKRQTNAQTQKFQ